MLKMQNDFIFSLCDEITQDLSRTVRGNIYYYLIDHKTKIKYNKKFDSFTFTADNGNQHIVYKTTEKWRCNCKYWSLYQKYCSHIYCIKIYDLLEAKDNLIIDYLIYRLRTGKK